MLSKFNEIVKGQAYVELNRTPMSFNMNASRVEPLVGVTVYYYNDGSKIYAYLRSRNMIAEDAEKNVVGIRQLTL
jgi:hypothetical protein